jgi:hypothetical protein
VSDKNRPKNADGVGDMEPHPSVSTGGHMDPTAPGEMPSDRHGAGTAERNRDRNAGLGEGLPREGADIPDPDVIGGLESSTRAGREVLDVVEGRDPDRGSAG